MTTVNIWNVEIATINEAEKKTEWRKIGVNLMWYQVLDVKRKYKGFITRHVRANNNDPECPTCGALTPVQQAGTGITLPVTITEASIA